MEKIIIIQHCQSEHHINNLTGGWTDTPLTETGKTQADQISKRICNIQNISQYKFISSDLLRAKQTAEIIHNCIKLPFIEDKRLREINNGDAAWKTKDWAKNNRNPRSKESFDINYREYKNGETWIDFFYRIAEFMDMLCSLNESSAILVTHGCALNYIIAWWLNFDLKLLEKSYFSASPGSISILDTNSYGQHALKLMNCTKHL
ncbi:MAG: histidine phosphatase family protein [Desulfobacter sp.]|nr:MAG: histidine phosphatase family protein [Desulfobacter sp.]